MNSLQRVLTALGQKEPDRVPFFLLLTMHGAKELGLSIREYYSRPEYVVEGQRRMHAKYRHDCLFGFYYASLETEAFGGRTIFIDDGPPNAAEPVIQKPEDIWQLEIPRVQDCSGLKKALETQRQLKEYSKGETLIIGVVMSPFSLPVMQMGFEAYLDLLSERTDLFERLMQINEEFCVEWANAQLSAGATAICYFDPLSSTTMVTREQYLQTGFQIARRTLARIKGPTATHFASGRCKTIIPDIIQTGTAIVGISIDENMVELKSIAGGRLTLLGNLNGIEMRRWSVEWAQTEVKKAIASAGVGGGFILSDNHGEIPFQVPDEVLLAISNAVHTWGTYPLNWVNENG